ncbi:TPA: hypothetical protein G8O65_000856 [Salmonella enterica]|nr:hypothetical protein [Salmonella enterica]HDJ1971249.1 hypothetical protein [Salmonella enterica subsp. enterica]HAK0559691.1 hypothetical protein [Salmonella enterica]HAK1821117.1 hypothetical protein [Salmonella enterica]HAK4351047.1 hypothetical protein [Salmonella enterica]
MNAVTNDELFDEILGRINHHDVRDDIERRVYEIALASLEAEPVAWMRDDADGREYNARNEFSGGGGGIPLYATPQVQVVPEVEPVAYQHRLWDTEYDEWGEWEDCGECAFECFVEEEKCQGAGVQTRKLYTVPQVSAVPDGLVKAVRFYEQVKHENPPVETGAWKDAVDWVLKEACLVAGIRIKGECFDKERLSSVRLTSKRQEATSE